MRQPSFSKPTTQVRRLREASDLPLDPRFVVITSYSNYSDTEERGLGHVSCFPLDALRAIRDDGSSTPNMPLKKKPKLDPNQQKLNFQSSAS